MVIELVKNSYSKSNMVLLIDNGNLEGKYRHAAQGLSLHNGISPQAI